MTVHLERVVIVTGAASGIGAAVARSVAGPGTALVLHTRGNRDALERVAEHCRSTGSPAETVVGDLAEAEVSVALVATARRCFGRVDQLVSNAGQAQQSRFGQLSTEELERAFAVMPLAFLRLVTASMPDLERSSWGRVLAVSSFVAHMFRNDGLPFPATAAAKAALEALAKSLAVQLGPFGTTVNCICPGYTRKESTHAATTSEELDAAVYKVPTGILVEPSQIAGFAHFVLSRAAGNMTGQVLHMDGGLIVK